MCYNTTSLHHFQHENCEACGQKLIEWANEWIEDDSIETLDFLPRMFGSRLPFSETFPTFRQPNEAQWGKSLFDNLAFGKPIIQNTEWDNMANIVVLPNSPLDSSTLLPGDVLLTRSIGDGKVWQAIASTGELLTREQAKVKGLQLNSEKNGIYLEVVAILPVRRQHGEGFARRISNERGYLLPDTLILQLKPVATKPDVNVIPESARKTFDDIYENVPTITYVGKDFLVIGSNTLLRDAALQPLKYNQGDTIPANKKVGDKVTLQPGTKVRISQVMRQVEKGDVKLYALVYDASNGSLASPLGWTSNTNFKGKMQGEIIGFLPASYLVSPTTSGDYFTVGNHNALLREGAPDFKPTKDSLKQGDFVSVVQTSGKYVQVKSVKNVSGGYQPASLLGWTAAANLVAGLADFKGPNAAWAAGNYIGQIDTLEVVDYYGDVEKISTAVYPAWQQMVQAATSDGEELAFRDAFRRYDDQRALYALYLSGKGNPANKPGYSNHQNGIAFDLIVEHTGNKGTGTGRVYNWLKTNATTYGFVRTVKGEAWHWEYRPDVAAKLKAQGKYKMWELEEEVVTVPEQYEIIENTSQKSTIAQTFFNKTTNIEYDIFPDGSITKQIPTCAENLDNGDIEYYYNANNSRHFIAKLPFITVDKRKDGEKLGCVRKDQKSNRVPKGHTATKLYPPGGDAEKKYIGYKNGDIVAEGNHNGKKCLVKYPKGTGTVQLVRMPDVLKETIGSVKIFYSFYNTQRRYCDPDAFAGFIGALAEMSFEDVQSTGMCFADATSFPSITHPNGDSIDTRYLRDAAGKLLTDREQAKISAFRKFHFENIIRGNATEFKSLTGHHRTDGGHNDHLHTGNFNKALVAGSCVIPEKKWVVPDSYDWNNGEGRQPANSASSGGNPTHESNTSEGKKALAFAEDGYRHGEIIIGGITYKVRSDDKVFLNAQEVGTLPRSSSLDTMLLTYTPPYGKQQTLDLKACLPQTGSFLEKPGSHQLLILADKKWIPARLSPKEIGYAASEGSSTDLVKTLLRLRDEKKLTGVTDEQIKIICGVAIVESGGKVNTINTYDSDYLSMGFIQFTLKGKIQELIGSARCAFRQYGIELDDVNQWTMGKEKISSIKGIIKPDDIRKDPLWIARFYEAGFDDEIIVAQVNQFIKNTLNELFDIEFPKWGIDKKDKFFRDTITVMVIAEIKNNRPIYAKTVVQLANKAKEEALKKNPHLTMAEFYQILKGKTGDVYDWCNTTKKGDPPLDTRCPIKTGQVNDGFGKTAREKGEGILTKINTDWKTVEAAWKDYEAKRKASDKSAMDESLWHSSSLELGLQNFQEDQKLPPEAILSDQLPSWETPEKTAFMKKVYDVQLARSTDLLGKKNERTGEIRQFFIGLPASKLAEVEAGQKMATAAAASCKALLDKARTDLAAAQSADDELAKKTSAIGIASAYRSLQHDFRAWQRSFKTNFNRGNNLDKGLTIGNEKEKHWLSERLDDEDVQLLAKVLGGTKAIPGFSNHTAGNAVDFSTTAKVNIGEKQEWTELGPSKSQRAQWRETWFFKWLTLHGTEGGFVQLPTEEWHWDYI